MSLDVIDVLANPLAQSGKPEFFLRLVLSKAAQFGMDGRTISMLDDIAAMLGFYQPLQPNQAALLAGPLVQWRTDPLQPTHERVHEVEKLVFAQRALIAFGGAPAGHMCGTAEIVVAMGNTIQGLHAPQYFDLFQWASIDVIATLDHRSKESVLKDPGKENWRLIPDDEVLKPGGRLYEAYVECATDLRRKAIAHLRDDPDNPRKYLRPLAAHFLESHAKVRAEAQIEGLTPLVKRLDEAMATIASMYPELGSVVVELDRQHEDMKEAVREELEDLLHTAGVSPETVEKVQDMFLANAGLRENVEQD